MNADRFAAEDARLAEQRANEAAYRADYDASGGPRFDPAQPFGTPSTEPAPAIRSVRRAFLRTNQETA
ncbi:hypothetical protein QFZ63_001625 [Streptomyces sp. B3I7]|uniref:hypothetical protein n=1 Tax=Streptomyces sp. B3I7 TaxID=3042269 RepID=UPI00277FA423|nr:hypothetical protein [Streptomyces sp. B3I7]MDQ0809911.1 hypothetical protein [Streptomyces sp. B3I7]